MAVDHCSQHEFFQSHLLHSNEKRMRSVVMITLIMMVAEILGGWWFGSMALLADGFHMATHAGALGISVFAYAYARKHAHDPLYSFGTGKVGDLAGFTSAVILLFVGISVVIESGWRLINPQPIAYGTAILIAILGLAVNVLSAMILKGSHVHHHHEEGPEHHHDHHHDNNFRSAYLHVVADALTSVGAIVALTCGWMLGWSWMDPLMGVVGAAVILLWALNLLRDTSSILLDQTPRTDTADKIRLILSSHGTEVTDLHIWRLGPNAQAAIIALKAQKPMSADDVRSYLKELKLAHVTVEINQVS